MIKIKNWVLNAIFPTVCLTSGIKLNKTFFCSVCKSRLPYNKKTCHRSAPYILAPAASYSDEQVRKLIWQLKYRGRSGNAIMLGNLLINYLKNLNIARQLADENFVIVPIPLSKNRLRQRGYNQAALIAKIVAEQIQLPIEESALVRVKDSLPQAETKDWDQRRKNIAGCFGVKNPEQIKNKNIILIDDVSTSGSTLAEAVHQLKACGAKKIIGLVAAKAG